MHGCARLWVPQKIKKLDEINIILTLMAKVKLKWITQNLLFLTSFSWKSICRLSIHVIIKTLNMKKTLA